MSTKSPFYETMVAPLEGQMIRSIWRIVRDADDADDALQQALEVIWKKRKRIENHPNPRALVLKICINASYDVLRKSIRIRRHEALDALESEAPDPAPGAVSSLEGKEQRAEILRAIASLPRNQAQAALLRIVQEQPYQAVAAALGCSEATARTHVKRARARLSRILAHLLPQSAREVES